MNSNEQNLSPNYAKIRQLEINIEFAPVDFVAMQASNYSDYELEEIALSIEESPDDDSINYQNNIKAIKEFRNKDRPI